MRSDHTQEPVACYVNHLLNTESLFVIDFYERATDIDCSYFYSKSLLCYYGPPKYSLLRYYGP